MLTLLDTLFKGFHYPPVDLHELLIEQPVHHREVTLQLADVKLLLRVEGLHIEFEEGELD